MHYSPIDDTFYLREFNQIKLQIELEAEEAVGIKTIFKRPSYRKRMFIVLIWVIGTQFTAVIPLQNYQFILYSALGLTNKMSLILVGVWGTVGVLCSAPGAWYFDTLGRRRAFFIAMGIMLPASILLCAFWATYQNSGNTTKVWGDLAILAMFLFLAGYAVIMNSFSYTYIPEIMPTAIRAAGVATAFTISNAFVIMLVQVTPIAIDAISWKFFMIFIFFDAIFLILFYFLYVLYYVDGLS